MLARTPDVVIVDPKEAAESVGLRYVSIEQPGIRRRKAGRGFRYLYPDGTTVTDGQVLRRIRAIVIPPAWDDMPVHQRSHPGHGAGCQGAQAVSVSHVVPRDPRK